MTSDSVSLERHSLAWRDRWALAASVVAPLVVTVALTPLRGSIANTDAALILVLVIVAVAANGHRLAGLVTALGAGAWFDFFLTQPYEHFTITRRADIETEVLLLLVGVAVTELAVWARRQQAEVSRTAGYTAGIRDAAAVLDDSLTATALVDRVGEQLVRLLGADAWRFDYGTGVLGGRQPRLRADGQVEQQGAVLDLDRNGLPPGQDLELLVTGGGAYRGRYLLRTARDSRPALAQRLMAVTLAERVGTVLSGSVRNGSN
jgi:K+-sensing histidine kinase KdpD